MILCWQMATQVMKLQNKEKRQLMLVKRNSMVKNIDSEVSGCEIAIYVHFLILFAKRFDH